MYTAGKCRLFWKKAGHKFSHPLGVRPDHQKYVRAVGQVSYVSCGCIIQLLIANMNYLSI